jgi:hypothetical protein
MDILKYLGTPSGVSSLPDRNPQGKTHTELHAIMQAEEADKEAYQADLDSWAKGRALDEGKYAMHTWREESILKAGYDKLVDLSQDYDAGYNPEADISTLPSEWPDVYKDAMKDAVNKQHFERLRERYQDQIDYNRESEYFGGKGTAINMAASIVHPENLLLGLGEASVLAKLGTKTATSRFVAGAAVGSLSNTAQELAIIANNKSRDKMGAVIAFGTGAALGGALSAFSKPGSTLSEVTKAKTLAGKDYASAAKVDLDISANPQKITDFTDTAVQYRGQMEGRLAKDPVSGKWVVGLKNSAVEYPNKEAAIKAYRELEKVGYYKTKSATAPVEDVAEQVERAELQEVRLTQDMADDLDRDIPKIKTPTGPLKSIGARGMSSDNPYERFLTWRTMEIASGTGGKHVANQSAALIADHQAHVFRSMYHPERLRLMKGWKADLNIKATPWDDSLGSAFDREVLKELHYRKYGGRPDGEAVNLNIGRMANLYSDIEVHRVNALKDARVYGYDGIIPDKLHTSNRWDSTRLARLTRTHGREFVIDLLKKGILSSKEFERTAKYAGKEITETFKEERAGYMAKAIYERFMARPGSGNLAKQAALSVRDRKLLEQRLREAIDDPMKIEHILHSADSRDSRVLKDYMDQIEVNYNANIGGVSVLDLLDSDLGRNMDSEFRKAAGRIGMAKQGFRDESQFYDATAQVAEWYQKNTKLDADSISKRVGSMQDLWRIVLGENLEKAPDSASARFARGLRRAASLASMNQVGFAQAAEFGRVTGALGVKTFLQQIPALGSMRRKMLNGTFKDPILRDIEAAFDVRLGDNHLLHHPLIMADSGGYGIANEASGAILKGLDTLTMKGMHVQGYINGMNQVSRLQQRMHARGFFMRMYDDVLKGARARRYADLGLGPEDLDNIKKQFQTHSTTTAGWFGQPRLENLNLQHFDPEVSEKLALAFHKAQAAAVQRNLGGEGGWYLESTLGKMLTQFRSFPLIALEKQTLHDLKFMDFESSTTLTASFGFATMAYMAKTYANSFGLPQQKRKQYMKNRIGTPAKIAAGAAGWMGQASLIPDVGDSIMSMTGFDNPFQYTDYKGARFRQYSQGLGIDKLGPGFSYFNNAYRFATGVHAAVMNGEELADHTLKRGIRLLPFSGSLGIVNAANTLIEED